MCLPVLYGYTSIVYREEVYAPSLPSLSKLMILSSAIHQLIMTLFSTMPFSIGQVQDAGLLFLSSMSTTIAQETSDSPHEAVPTAVVLLPVFTTMTGVALIIMGRLRLAGAVAYIPNSVVGGYLAFIGYFCLQAGVALCVSRPMSTIASWSAVADGEGFRLALPGVAAGAAMLWVSRKRAELLPHIMMAVPLAFFAAVYLWYGEDAIDKARGDKWIGAKSSSSADTGLDSVISQFDFSNVRWDIFPDLIPCWIGMVFVISFSSSLDVAAISMDMGQPLNTDKELEVIGYSNVVSGLTGGYTGSYIFSQTIFQYRTMVHSRWVGFVIAALELCVFAAKVDVLSYSPLFFFGATLIFIGLDLLLEWLIESRTKLMDEEYCILILTFLAIQAVGIDAGIIVGVVMALVEFVITNRVYSEGKKYVRRVERRSRKVRPMEAWKELQKGCYKGQVVTFELRGELFFGNCERVRKILESAVSPPFGEGRSGGLATKHVVLDFHTTTTCDSSASSSLKQFVVMANKNGVKVLGAGFTSRVRYVLSKGGVLGEEGIRPNLGGKIAWFVSVSKALEHCEDGHLGGNREATHLLPPTKSWENLKRQGGGETWGNIVKRLLGLPDAEGGQRGLDMVLNKYHEVVELEAGNSIFRQFEVGPEGFEGYSDGGASSSSESFYVILQGQVLSFSTGHELQGTYLDKGAVVGYVDFLLDRPRSFNAVVVEKARVAKITREDMHKMKEADGAVFNMVERCVLLASILELANTSEC
ncbi:hypothetical protein TrRE_jg3586 [Triparma retinervis]|uniref:Sulfate transporter n=1 Tax=Triparma retinervis TaxID=2557542 RepID=A0A9W7G7T9_9STRA|nr:hypothetical protein TrRE_jg3586 [Triparma retinervis]